MTTVINFTKANLESLPIPSTGRVEYQDAKTPGLKIRVTANNIKTFCVLKRVKGGTPLRTTLGRFPEMSIEQARRQAAVILAEIAEGGNPAEVKRALKAELTFAELFKIYFERHAKVHKISANTDELNYKNHLEKPLGKKKLSAITKEEITAIHYKITRNGHPIVANRVLSLLSTVFNRGIEWSITMANPCYKIRRNEEKSHERHRYIMPEEFSRFFSALKAVPNHTIRDYIWMSLLTGARRKNVLTMKWSEISMAERMLHIPKTKDRTAQNIPLPKQAIDLLKIRRKVIDEKEVYVFPGDGVTGHLVEPKYTWAKLLKRADITGLRIHDLRRTLGSWQVNSGASISVIAKTLNHKSIQTTLKYARLQLDPVRDSMNTATEAMFKAGKAKPKA